MLPVNIGMYKFFGIIKGKSNNYEDIRLLGTLSSKKLFFFLLVANANQRSILFFSHNFQI